MKKIIINEIQFYVGSGVEMRRLWRKAVFKKGFYSYHTEEPRYNVAGTYCLTFDDGQIHWDNFLNVVKWDGNIKYC